MSGYIVIVTSDSPGTAAPARKAYFVAESDPRKATEIIRREAAYAALDQVEAVAPLAEDTLRFLRLRRGEFAAA